MLTTTPATKATETTWQAFTLFMTPTFPEGIMVRQYTGNVGFSTNDYLGDESGAPVAAVALNQNPMSRFLEHGQITAPEFLGELVTREDGSKATILQILGEKLEIASKPVIVPTPSV